MVSIVHLEFRVVEELPLAQLYQDEEEELTFLLKGSDPGFLA